MLLATKITNVLSSIFLLSVIATFPTFFIFNPLQFGVTMISLLQVGSTIAWIVLLFSPVFILHLKHVSKKRAIIQSSLVLFWPVMVMLIRVFLLVSIGDPGISYLLTSPVFAVTDFILPIGISILLFRSTRDNTHKGKLIDKNFYF